jgi:UDP-N-acetylglucosamine--N-acetylmuramyl-(pentapeptide) pyrophosphoryl-undecaprenol N-acetylglucosamine transferase
VLTSFPETAEKLPNGKYSGAPIRRSILHGTRAEARRKFNIPFDEKVLLVFGGGSGSRILNESVRSHLHNLTKNYTVLHVCGKGNKADTTFKNYRQEEFIPNMGDAYACADVVLSRAGAGTIFELLTLKKPALLVPLEGATRGDQKQNAEYFRKKGLCRVLSQKHLDRLSAEINRTFADIELRATLQETNVLTGNENILQEIRKFLRK